VAAFAAHRRPGAMHSYTVALAGHAALDESHAAEAIARQIGTTHISIRLSQGEVEQSARRWFAAVDQPSIDGLNTFIVAGAARQCGIKVVLSGLGGDELFGGYRTFETIPRLKRWLQLLATLPPAWRVRLVRTALARKPEFIQRMAEDLILANPTSLLALLMARRRLFSTRSLREFGFEPGSLALDDVWIDAQQPARGQLPPEAQPDALAEISAIESSFYMRNTLLRDTDVMGMAHGMELRVPLLDQPLVDYVGRLPGAWRVRQHGVNKPLLAEAAANVLRDPEIARRPKHGFCLPHAAWMRGALRAEFEGKLDALKRSGWIDAAMIDRTWQAFHASSLDGGWPRVWALGILGHIAGVERG